jgi:type VI secretion system secreted protein Hcp
MSWAIGEMSDYTCGLIRKKRAIFLKGKGISTSAPVFNVFKLYSVRNTETQTMRILVFLTIVALSMTIPMAHAGELTPSSAPAPTMHSLDEIYSKIDEKAAADPDHSQGSEASFIHMTLTGETSGLVNGSSTAPGREDTIALIGFSHEVISPRDAASGLPTGKRQHKPLNVTKFIDKSTPILFHILASNENITELEITFYRSAVDGSQEPYYRIELVNASIAGIRTEYPNLETVTFAYQKVIWTWVDGGITAEDDWETPVAK